jgi:predicted amidophosphoribosyltransferase
MKATRVKLDRHVVALLRCALCKADLSQEGGGLLRCWCCGSSFPKLRVAGGGDVRFSHQEAVGSSTCGLAELV